MHGQWSNGLGKQQMRPPPPPRLSSSSALHHTRSKCHSLYLELPAQSIAFLVQFFLHANRFNLKAEAESSRTTPTIVEYECCGQDTLTTGLRHIAADSSPSSYYSRPPGQLISASAHSQSAPATGGAAGHAGRGGTGIAQAAYFGAAPVETTRSDRGMQKCVPWVPRVSTSQSSSQEATVQQATNSRPRRGVARPLSYQEPSLNIKMRK